MNDVIPEDPVARYFLEDSVRRHAYQHEFSLGGFKTLILLNGGAIISLLTYLGHGSTRQMGDGLSDAFVSYVVGLVAVVLAYLAGYFSQGSFLNATAQAAFKRMNVETDPSSIQPERHVFRGYLWIAAGVAMFVLSLLGFIAGSWFAMKALS